MTATPTNDQIRLNDEFLGEPHTLTFTPENWNFDQTIRATALDDSVVEYLHTSEIEFEVETGETFDFESKADNSKPKNALDLGTIRGGYQWSNLAIADAGGTQDVDWFAFTLPDEGNERDFVQIDFQHAQGDLQLELYHQSDLENPIQESDSSSNSQNLEKISLEGQPFGEYYLKVSGQPNNYDLLVADEDHQYTSSEIVPEPAPVVIEDNDLPTVSVEAGPTASEVFGKPSYFNFQLNAPAPQNNNGIKVNYKITGGTATFQDDNQLGDYRASAKEGSIRIAPGDIQNNLAIAPIDDKLTEDRTLQVTSVNNNGNLELGIKTPTPKQQVLGFDGVDDYVEVPNSEALNITENLTVEAKIYLDEENFSGNRRILQKGGDSSSQGKQVSDQYRFLVEDNKFKFDVGGVGVVEAPIVELPGRAWHHVAGVYDRSKNELAIYVNGEKIETLEGVSGTIKTTDDPLYIGTKNPNAIQGDFWKGQLDEIRIWNTARTSEQIQANQSNSLAGNEEGLVAYYAANQQDDTSTDDTSTLRDLSNNQEDGSLHNGASYIKLPVPSYPESIPVSKSTEIKFADGLVGTVQQDAKLQEKSGFYEGTVKVQLNDPSRNSEIETGLEGKLPSETVQIELLPGEGYKLPDNPKASLSIQDDDVPGVRIVQVGDNTVVREGETATFQVSLLSEPKDDVTLQLTPGAEIQFVDPVNPETVSVDKDVYSFEQSKTGNLDVSLNSLVTTERGKTVAFDIKLNEQPSSDVVIKLYDANDSDNEAEATVDFTQFEEDVVLGQQPGNWDQTQQVIIGNLDPNNSDGKLGLKAEIYEKNEDGSLKKAPNEEINLPINYTTETVEKQTTEITIPPEKWFELQTVTVEGVKDAVAEPGLYHQSGIDYQVTSNDSNYNNIVVPQQRIDVADRVFNAKTTAEGMQEGFTNLQKSLDQLEIPLIGSLDGKTPNLISDINDRVIPAVGDEENLSANRLKAIIEDSLSTLGLEFLDVSVDMSENSVDVAIDVSKSYPLFSLPIDANLGLDALGIGLETDGELQSNFDFDVVLGFGISEDYGFYLDTEKTQVEASIQLNLNDFKGQGNLGFLRLDTIDDPENPTELAVNFQAGLNDLDNYQTIQFFDVDGDHQLDAEAFNYPIENPDRTPNPETRTIQEPFVSVNSQGKAEVFPKVGEAPAAAKRINANGNNTFDTSETIKNEGIYRTQKDSNGKVTQYYFDLDRDGRLDSSSGEQLLSVDPTTTKWMKNGQVKPFRIEQKKVKGELKYYFDRNGDNNVDTNEILTKKQKAKLDRNSNGKLDADREIEGEGTFVQGTGIAFQDTNNNGLLDVGEPYVNSEFGDLKLENSNSALSFLDIDTDRQQSDNELLILEETDEETQESFAYLDLNQDREFSSGEPKLIEDSQLGFSYLNLVGNANQEQTFADEPKLPSASNDEYLDLNQNDKEDPLLEPIINQEGEYLTFYEDPNSKGDDPNQPDKILDYNRNGEKDEIDGVTDASVETGTLPNGESFQYLDTNGDGYWTREHKVFTKGNQKYLDINDNGSQDSDDRPITIEENLDRIKSKDDRTIYLDKNNNDEFNEGELLLLDSLTGRLSQDTNKNGKIDRDEPIVNIRFPDSQLKKIKIETLNDGTEYLDEIKDQEFTGEYKVLTDKDEDNNQIYGQVLDTNNNGDVDSDEPLIVFSEPFVREKNSLSLDASNFFVDSFQYLDFNNNGKYDDSSDSNRFPQEYKVREDSDGNNYIDENNSGSKDGNEPTINLVNILTNGSGSIRVGEHKIDPEEDLTLKFYDRDDNGKKDKNEPFIMDRVTFLDLNQDSQLTLDEEESPDEFVTTNQTYLDFNGNNINDSGEPQLDKKEDNWVINLNEDNLVTYKITNNTIDHPDSDINLLDTISNRVATFLGLSASEKPTYAELLGLTVNENQVIDSAITFIDLEEDEKLDLLSDPILHIQEGVQFIDLDNNGSLTVNEDGDPIEPFALPNNEFDTENFTDQGPIINYLDDGDRLTLTELQNWKNNPDLGFSDLFNYEFSGLANLGLATKTSFEGNPAFPSFNFNLGVGLPLFNYSNQEEAAEEGFNVDFNDIQIDVGGFLTNLATPVIETVDEIISPAKPVLDILNADTKIFSQLGLEDEFNQDSRPGVSLLDITKTIANAIPEDTGDKKLQRIKNSVDNAIQFTDTVNQIVETAESLKALTESEDNLTLELGSYNLDDFKAASDDPADSTSQIPADKGTQKTASGKEATADTQKQLLDSTKQSGSEKQQKALSYLMGDEGSKLAGLDIPFLTNPVTPIKILLGQENVDLITYDIPDLDFFFGKEQEFLLWTPPIIEGILELGFEAQTDLSVGYDTAGLEAWQDSNFELSEIYKILDGFYVDDFDEDGKDKDELIASATIAAGLSASAVVAKAVLKGGIEGTLGFDLIDEGELQGKNDGKVRGSEIISRLDTPLELFDLKGQLDAFVNGSIKVGVDLGLFEIMKEVWSTELRTVLTQFNQEAIGNESGNVLTSKFSLGYVDGATVWFDTNGNRLLDLGEVQTTTKADGSFDLSVPDDVDILNGVLRARGGVDVATGLPVQGVLSASSESAINPVTSLIQQLIEQDVDKNTAQERVQTAFSISDDVNLFEFDYVDATLKEDPNARAVLLANNSVQGVISGIHNLLAGASGGTVDTQDTATSAILSNAAFSALSELMDGRSVNLEDSTVLSNVIRSSAANAQTLATEEGLQLGLNNQEVEDIVDAAAKLLAAGVTKKRLLAEESSDGIELLTAITQAKLVSHGEEAQALNELARGEKSINEILEMADTSEAALEAIRQVKLKPQLAGLDNVNISEGEQLKDIPITLFDFETSYDQLDISITSDNSSLLPADNVSVSAGGQAHQALLSLSPIDGEAGVATISITVEDGDGNTLTEEFTVNISDEDTGGNEDGNEDSDSDSNADPSDESSASEATNNSDRDRADNDVDGDAGNEETNASNREETINKLMDNHMTGSDSDDTLEGTAENDAVTAGNGNDAVATFSGNDRLYGEAGNDIMNGNQGNDFVDGGDGNDILFGGQGKDNLQGGNGNDILNGNLGEDKVNGNDGDDILFGGQQADILNGGSGNDLLSGDLGEDTLTGGQGSDRFLLRNVSGPDIITDFEDGVDSLVLPTSEFPVQPNGVTFEDLTITQAEGGTVISVNGNTMAGLTGVDASNITEDDFQQISSL
ncbi:LamG-like jellyroll fold domain-containing protein [Geitlerinema sp. PCC 9228]|uniref:LamG-like jellyroll fold domain-containing protein n=1 Tax=Geitlerinema sp. PCC 9228 TaxID=111611 RepID=UPI001B8CE6FB|nr:LamG-like jellyroll fold domain-containing protein [Geitlerinema sp. PCC 9228]